MTDGGAAGLSAIPIEVENPDEWSEIYRELSAMHGVPPALTLDAVTALVASAVPILFHADATHSVDVMRGTFSNQVIAQCGAHLGCLLGVTPTSALLRLIGAPARRVPPVLRVRIIARTIAPQGHDVKISQFWDIEFDSETTVSMGTCPNCGAPLAAGQLVCSHCHSDARAKVEVPLLVNRLQIY